MTAPSATPRQELTDRLIRTELEIVVLLERLQILARRLGRVEGESGEALGQLRDARRKTRALCRVD